MTIKTNTLRTFAALLVSAAVAIGFGPAASDLAHAADAAAAIGKNSIQAIEVNDQGGQVVIRLTLSEEVAAPPPSFSVMTPPRIAFDFHGTSNGLGTTVQKLDVGALRSANVVQVGDRTRVVLNLNQAMPYDTRVDGKHVFVTLTRSVASQDTATQAAYANFSANKGSASGVGDRSIRDVAFRRGQDGEGRIVVELPSPDTAIDIRRMGSSLVVEFLKTTLPEPLRRRLDVTDFGTPVTEIATQEQGGAVRMTITPQGLWEHNAYQSDNQFVLEVKRVIEDPRKLVQGHGPGYHGEKLSLNFQNIDVRSVLQVIADFTNFNIITSDSVQGSLTLRLKDVPWDQALDIILQARGLDKRKNGNVIWIAPRDELAAREKLELEAKQQIGELEPLVTETFRINYHQARSIANFLSQEKQSILSKRGSVVVDERSNKLFVQDVPSKLDELRSLIAEIDLPARQVLIEARIVEASDTFSRDLGARLGFGSMLGGKTAANGFPQYNIGGGLEQTGFTGGLIEDQPVFGDNQAVNLAASPDNGLAPGLLSLVLWNAKATRFLDLEISALEADGRGKVVSRPKVMTADQIEALIEQGTEIPYREATSSGAASVSFRKATLSLRVKPQITPDGRVLMSLEINKDSPQATELTAGVPIDTKHVRTEVLVENGGTVVIGGIYVQDTGTATNKVPLLGDIPVVGHLFKQTTRRDNKTELIVFITPRIVEDHLVSR
ncbi:MAG: type IV pilus secretin PilQ [Rhodocyclaceae bacterium]|nr:type IV pilus secretin PilQ [Rhodocyclaceae bacterium]